MSEKFPINPDINLEQGSSELDRQETVVNAPFFDREKLAKTFELHHLKEEYINSLKPGEVNDFIDRIGAFQSQLMDECQEQKIIYGDGHLLPSDLMRFSAYCILVGVDFENCEWVDLEDGRIEKFFRNGFKN